MSRAHIGSADYCCDAKDKLAGHARREGEALGQLARMRARVEELERDLGAAHREIARLQAAAMRAGPKAMHRARGG